MSASTDSTKLRIRVAELMGWKRITKPPPNPNSLWPDEAIWEMMKHLMIPPDGNLLRACGTSGIKMVKVPAYDSDLNACHEFEKTLDAKQRKEYTRDLNEGYGAGGLDLTDVFLLIHATAEQRCRAFIAVMEKQDSGEKGAA